MNQIDKNRLIYCHKKRVPLGISVIGYGDSPWSELYSPPLTVLKQNVSKIIESSNVLMMKLLQGERPETKKINRDTVFGRLIGTVVFVDYATENGFKNISVLRLTLLGVHPTPVYPGSSRYSLNVLDGSLMN